VKNTGGMAARRLRRNEKKERLPFTAIRSLRQ